MWSLLALLVAAAPEAAAPAQVRRIPLVDTCAADSSFVAFRNDLLAAIERRDAAFILSVATEDIEYTFGGEPGREAFARDWELNRPATSPLWHELGDVLRLGCVHDNSEQSNWAPAIFMSDELEDPFGTSLVIHPGAEMHAAADASSPVLAQLDWDLVDVVEWNGQDPWQRVRTVDGREGFVRSADLRSPADYRAGFRRIGGRWRMTTFITGD
jgi:hypothetical protein